MDKKYKIILFNYIISKCIIEYSKEFWNLSSKPYRGTFQSYIPTNSANYNETLGNIRKNSAKMALRVASHALHNTAYYIIVYYNRSALKFYSY